MVIAFDATEVRDYSLVEDKEPKTVFKIGILDTPLRAWLNDMLTAYSVSRGDVDAPADVKINLNAMHLEAVRFGLKGWDNFKDKLGQDIPFTVKSIPIPKVGNRNGLCDIALSKLRFEWIAELAKEILRQNNLDKEEIKN